MRATFAKSPFDNIIVAATSKGICHLAFFEEQRKAFEALEDHFPNAHFMQMVDLIQQNTSYIFRYDWDKLSEIKLHLKGTDFQLKVWQTLLKIPIGQLSTYGAIAEQIDNSKASRALGTAIGKNLVAFLIPCHWVIQSTGSFGGYMWGATRKAAIIGWEAAKVYRANLTEHKVTKQFYNCEKQCAGNYIYLCIELDK